jgi:hypothetical protein
MIKRSRMPRDPAQLAKMVVDLATGNAPPEPVEPPKDPAAVSLGRRGGLKGGPARAKKLSKKRLSEIGKKAAAKRWGKKR